MKNLIILSVFIFLLSGFLHPITAMAQDLGRHLLTGKIILETGNIPKTNLFSYTYPNFPFINHHWGSEVILYLTNEALGFNGLLLLTVIAIMASFSLVFFYSLKNARILPVTIVSILYILIFFERPDVRPEIFSFLFLSSFIVILYKFREGFTRWIFALPLLQLIWVNTHIYFFTGLGVIGLFLIESIISMFLKHRAGDAIGGRPIERPQRNPQGGSPRTFISGLLRWDEKAAGPARIKTLIFVFLFSALATLLNPNGLAGAIYPLHVFQNYGYQIEENQNVFFLWTFFNGKTTILFFFISCISLFASLLLTIRKARLIDWLLSFFFMFLGAIAERNFPLFILGTFIPFTRSLSIISSNFAYLTFFRRLIIFLLIVILFWQTIETVKIKKFGFGVQDGPKNAADFFIENNLKGPIFNNFDIGSYLEYRLYPKEKIFVDGRPEAYPNSFFQDVYVPLQISVPKFEEFSQKYKFNTIFFSHTDFTPWADAFLPEIVKNTGWKIIYLDDFVIILVKDVAQNKQIIEKFAIAQDSPKISNLKPEDMQNLSRFYNFFQRAGWTQQQFEISLAMLKLDPNFCPALYTSYVILSTTNPAQAAIYLQKYQNRCI